MFCKSCVPFLFRFHTYVLLSVALLPEQQTNRIDDTHPGFHGAVHLEKHWFRHGTPLEHDDHGVRFRS